MTVLNDCGCCEGITLRTPVAVNNRPGLTAIAYRVGTHAQFKASMLSRLSGADLPELANLRTRDENDFTIAFIDAWALVSDILTFYQERIANESYLRTATERGSIINLSRLIGYELRPGVAATTYLAFTLETGAGSPAEVPLEEGLKVQSVPGPGEKPQVYETIEKIDARPEWNALKPLLSAVRLPQFGDTSMYLAGVTTNLKPGDAFVIAGDERIGDAKNKNWDFRRITAVEPDAANDRTLIRWNEGLGSATPRIEPARENPKIYALRLRASLFGFNAQKWETLPVALRVGDVNPDPAAPPAKKFLPGPFTDEKKWADTPFTATTKAVNLDAVYSQIVVDSWVVLASAKNVELYRVTSVSEEAKADFNISAKTTRVEISGENIKKFSPRNAAVFTQSEELALAGTPLTEPLLSDEIPLDSVVDGLLPDRTLIVAGRRMRAPAAANDETVSEVVQLEDTFLGEDGSHTVLKLTKALTNVYDRNTVTIFANVALSTHGETVQDEVLGSGDAGRPYQHFALRQAPLTYTPADTASGGESTLEVRVNDLKWAEVSTLFGRGPRERIYVTHADEEQETTVQFGDGITGARLPMGHENVKATYRKGIGLEGLVDAGQLSLLMTRPLGVRGVANPIPSAGAQDPQDLDDARANSPLTVLTLDRIVSLRDYEDFARSFSGIAKALATWTWSGHTRRVFVTVAGINGAEVRDDSLLKASLVSAMQKAGDSFVPIAIKSYRNVTFNVFADIKVDPDYIQDNVFAAVRSALRESFAFDARSFGQPVTRSEVIAVMQNVAGVVAVDLNRLLRTGESETADILTAFAPEVGADPNTPAAELLTLDAGPIELGVMP